MRAFSDVCLARYCPPLMVPNYARLSTSRTDYGIVVAVSCYPGYKFSNGSLAYVMCTDTLSEVGPDVYWNNTQLDPSCQRRVNVNSF